MILLACFIAQDFGLAEAGIAKLPQGFFQASKIDLSLPESIAQVTGDFRSLAGAAENSPTFYLIQDAHTNKSAQMNIARIIKHLAEKENVSLVLLESGTGDDSLSFLKDKAGKEQIAAVAKIHMEKGWLQGPDYADLTGDVPVKLWGVEDKALYWKEIEIYKNLKETREHQNAYLHTLSRATRTLKAKLYFPLLALFDSQHEAFLKNESSLTDYLGLLIAQGQTLQIDLSDFPHLSILKSIQEKEKGVDFKKASSELEAAFKALSTSDQKELGEAFLKLKSKKMYEPESSTALAFYLALQEKLRGAANTAEYPSLMGYMGYLKEADRLNASEVLGEKEKLEALVYGRLIRNEDEKRLWEISNNLEILRRLVNLKATSSDFMKVKNDEQSFDVVEIGGFLNRKIMDLQALYEDAIFTDEKFSSAFRQAVEFYEIADRRDEAFLKNALEKIKEEKTGKAILVAGGYHTAHLQVLLKEKNISYASVTPKILDETNDKKYESILLSQTATSAVGVLPARELVTIGASGEKFIVAQSLAKDLAAKEGARLSAEDQFRDFGEKSSWEYVVHNLLEPLYGQKYILAVGACSLEEYLKSENKQSFSSTRISDIQRAVLSLNRTRDSYAKQLGRIENYHVLRTTLKMSDTGELVPALLILFLKPGQHFLGETGARLSQASAPGRFSFRYWAANFDRLFILAARGPRTRFIEKIRPLFERTSNVYQTEGYEGKPDAYFLLGNHDIRGFKEFAKKWIEETRYSGRKPIVIAGGIGNATEDLSRNLKKIYRPKLPPRERVKLDDLLIRGASEAEMVEFILNREGIPSVIGSKQIIYLEKLSTNTKENVQSSKVVFEKLAKFSGKARFNISVGTTKLHEERTFLTILEQWKMSRQQPKEGWAVKVEPFYDTDLEDYSDQEIINAVGFGFGYPANWKPKQTDVNRRSEIEKIEEYSGKETPDIASSSRSKEGALKEILAIQKIRIQDFSEFIASTRSWKYRAARLYLRLKVFLFKFWGGRIVYRFAKKSIDPDKADRVINRIVWETPYLDENGKVMSWEKTWLRVWEKEADQEPNLYEKNKLLFLAQGFSEAEVENDEEPFSSFRRMVYKISRRLFLGIFSHEPILPKFKPESDEVRSVNKKLKESYVEGRKYDYRQVGTPMPDIQKMYIPISSASLDSDSESRETEVASFDDYANGRIPSVLTLPNGEQFPGPRPTVIFFHGITNRKEHPYMDGLEKHLVTHGFAVLRVDLPRHGEYEEGIYGPEFFTKEYFPALQRFVQHHPRLQKKMALFGFSFGANVAFRIYLSAKAENGQEVVAVTLLSPPINKSLGNPSSRGIKQFYKGARHIFIEGNPVVILIKLSQYVFDLSKESVRNLDYGPALVVYGRKDELVPNSDQTLIKKVVERGGGKVTIFKEDDHYLSEKNYEEFCRIALNHFQSKFGMEQTEIESLPIPRERSWGDAVIDNLVIDALVFFKRLFRLPFFNGAQPSISQKAHPDVQSMKKLRSLFQNDIAGLLPQKLKIDLYAMRDLLADQSANSQFTDKEGSAHLMRLVRRINDLALKAQKMDFNRLDEESALFVEELKSLLREAAFYNRLRLDSFLMRFVNAVSFGDWEEDTSLFVSELQNKAKDAKLELRVLTYFADLLRLYPLYGSHLEERAKVDDSVKSLQGSMQDLLKEYDLNRSVNGVLFNEVLSKIEQTDALYKGISSFKRGQETQPGYELKYDPTHKDLWKLLRNRQAARDAAGARLSGFKIEPKKIWSNLRRDWGFWTSLVIFSVSAIATIIMINILSHQGVDFPGDPSTPILLRDDAVQILLESYFELPPTGDLNIGYHNMDFRARLAYFLSAPVLVLYYYLLSKGRVFPKRGVNAVLTGAIAGAGLFYNLEITYWLLFYGEFVVTNYWGKQYMNFQDGIWFAAFPLLGGNILFWWVRASLRATSRMAASVIGKNNGKSKVQLPEASSKHEKKDEKPGARLTALSDDHLSELAGKIEHSFDVYFRAYKRITNRATARFENKDWNTLQDDVTSRIHLYATTLNRFEAVTNRYLGGQKIDADIWRRLFAIYHARVEKNPDAQLAVAFFNSVMRRAVKKISIPVQYSFSGTALRRKAVNNTYRAYKNKGDLKDLARKILKDIPLKQSLFMNAEADAKNISGLLEREISGKGLKIDKIEILKPIFFRNKGAYIVGRIVAGDKIFPLVLPLLNEENGVYVDTALADEETANNIFSTVRANFHVRVDDYESLVDFLQSILPRRPRADFYSAIGFEIPAKVELMKELYAGLLQNGKKLEKSEGRRGNVMAVFTLPNLPYALKVIRDSSDQHSSPEAVMKKYEKVHEMDRVGRMLDAMYFQNLRFKISDFDPALLEELKQSCSQNIIMDSIHQEVVIKNVYIQRKVTPLDVYLADETVSEEKKLRVLDDLARCIRELALSGIFQGDYQAKNFGVTHFGRVVSYDYDGLQDIADIRFKKIPEEKDDDDPYAKPTFYYGSNDAFPEDTIGYMGIFLGSINIKPGYAEYFKSRHHYLFTVRFWEYAQEYAHSKTIPDIFPYRQDKRFGHTPAKGSRLAESYPEIKGETNWLRYRQIAATIRDFNVYRFFMLNKSLYRQRPYEPYPFDYEDVTSPEFSEIAGADLEKDMGTDWKNIYEKAKKNILKTLQNKTIFSEGSDELIKHFPLIGVFTDTVFLANNPSMKPYRKNIVRSSHGRPSIFVSVRYFADLNTDNASEINFAAFALKDAMEAYLRYKQLKNSPGLSNEEIAENLNEFRTAQDKEESRLMNKRLLRTFREINGRDHSVMRGLRKIFRAEYDAFMKATSETDELDSTKSAEYLLEDALIEGGKGDEKESLRKKFIDLQKQAIDLARRSFVVRRLEVTAKILNRMRENLLQLSIVDKGDIVMQRLAIYIIALARAGHYNELIWALRYLADGNMPDFKGRSIQDERQLFLSYATSLHLFQVVQSVLTRHMEAMTKEPNRKVVLQAQQEAVRLMEKIGLKPDDGKQARPSGARLSSDSAEELTPLPLIDSAEAVRTLVESHKNYAFSYYLNPSEVDDNFYMGISLDSDSINLDGILKTHRVQSKEESAWRILSPELVIHDATNYRTRAGLIFEIPKSIQERFSLRLSAPLSMTRRSWLVFYDKSERKYVFIQVTFPGKGLAIRRYFVQPHSLHDKAAYAQTILNDAYEEMDIIFKTRQDSISQNPAEYILEPVLKTWDQVADLELDARAQTQSAELSEKFFRDKYSYLIKESKDSIMFAVNRLTDDKTVPKEDLNFLLRLHGPVSRVIRTLSFLLKAVDTSEIRSFGDPWPVPASSYQATDQDGEIYWTVNLERRMDPSQVTFQFYHPKVNEKGEVQIFDPWVAGEGILVEAFKDHPSIKYKYKLPKGVDQYTVRAKAGGPRFEWLGYNILVDNSQNPSGARLADTVSIEKRVRQLQKKFPDLAPSVIKEVLRYRPEYAEERLTKLLAPEKAAEIINEYPFIPKRKLAYLLVRHPNGAKKWLDSKPIFKKWYGVDLRRMAYAAFYESNQEAQTALLKEYGAESEGYVVKMPKNGRLKFFKYKNAEGKESMVQLPAIHGREEVCLRVERDRQGFFKLLIYDATGEKLIFDAYFDRESGIFLYDRKLFKQKVIEGHRVPFPRQAVAVRRQDNNDARNYFIFGLGNRSINLPRPASIRFKGVATDARLETIYVRVRVTQEGTFVYGFMNPDDENPKDAIGKWKWVFNKEKGWHEFQNIYFFVPETPNWLHGVLKGTYPAKIRHFIKFKPDSIGRILIYQFLHLRLGELFVRKGQRPPDSVLAVNSPVEHRRLDIYEAEDRDAWSGLFSSPGRRFIASKFYDPSGNRFMRSWEEATARFNTFLKDKRLHGPLPLSILMRTPIASSSEEGTPMRILEDPSGKPVYYRSSSRHRNQPALLRFIRQNKDKGSLKGVELVGLDENLMPNSLIKKGFYDPETGKFEWVPDYKLDLNMTHAEAAAKDVFALGYHLLAPVPQDKSKKSKPKPTKEQQIELGSSSGNRFEKLFSEASQEIDNAYKAFSKNDYPKSAEHYSQGLHILDEALRLAAQYGLSEAITKSEELFEIVSEWMSAHTPYFLLDYRAPAADIDDIIKNISGIPDIEAYLAIPHFNAKWHREGGPQAVLRNHLEAVLIALKRLVKQRDLKNTSHRELVKLVKQVEEADLKDLEATILTHDLGKRVTGRQHDGNWSFAGHEQASYDLLSKLKVLYDDKPLSQQVKLTVLYHDMHWRLDYKNEQSVADFFMKLKGGFKGSDEEFDRAVQFLTAFSVIDSLGAEREKEAPDSLDTVEKFAAAYEKFKNGPKMRPLGARLSTDKQLLESTGARLTQATGQEQAPRMQALQAAESGSSIFSRRNFLTQAAGAVAGFIASSGWLRMLTAVERPGKKGQSPKILVDAGKVLHPTNFRLFGNNIEWVNDAEGLYDPVKHAFNPKAIAHLKKLKITSLRFPGGTFSDVYHWKDGVGPDRKDGTHVFNKAKLPSNFGTEEFLKLCKILNAQPVFTVNTLTGTAQEAAEWVDAVGNTTKQIGSKKAVYWEIGNEPYLQTPNDFGKISAEEYSQKYIEFVQLMKARDPTIKVGIPLRNNELGRYPGMPEANKDWNKRVLAAIQNASKKDGRLAPDFAAVHNTYFPVLLPQEKFDKSRHFKTLLAATEEVKEDIQKTRKILKQYFPKNPIPIAITEFNAFFASPDRPEFDFTASHASALYTASLLANFIKDPSLLMANYFSLVRNAKFGLLNHADKPRPAYYVHQIFSRYVGEKILSSSSLDGPLFDSVEGGFMPAKKSTPGLDVLASRTGNDLFIIMINKTDQTLQPAFKIENFAQSTGIGPISGLILEGPLEATNEKRETIAPKNLKIDKPKDLNEYKAAPYSITAIKISRLSGARLAGRYAVGSPSWFKTLDLEAVPPRDFDKHLVPVERVVRERIPTVFKIFLGIYVHAHVFFLSGIEAIAASVGLFIVTLFYSRTTLLNHTYNFRFLRMIAQYRREASWKAPMSSLLESLWKYLDDPELADAVFIPLLVVSNYVPDLEQALKNRRDLKDKIDGELYALLFREKSGARLARSGRQMHAIRELMRQYEKMFAYRFRNADQAIQALFPSNGGLETHKSAQLGNAYIKLFIAEESLRRDPETSIGARSHFFDDSKIRIKQINLGLAQQAARRKTATAGEASRLKNIIGSIILDTENEEWSHRLLDRYMKRLLGGVILAHQPIRSEKTKNTPNLNGRIDSDLIILDAQNRDLIPGNRSLKRWTHLDKPEKGDLILTYAWLGDAVLEVVFARDFWLNYKNGITTREAGLLESQFLRNDRLSRAIAVSLGEGYKAENLNPRYGGSLFEAMVGLIYEWNGGGVKGLNKASTFVYRTYANALKNGVSLGPQLTRYIKSTTGARLATKFDVSSLTPDDIREPGKRAVLVRRLLEYILRESKLKPNQFGNANELVAAFAVEDIAAKCGVALSPDDILYSRIVSPKFPRTPVKILGVLVGTAVMADGSPLHPNGAAAKVIKNINISEKILMQVLEGLSARMPRAEPFSYANYFELKERLLSKINESIVIARKLTHYQSPAKLDAERLGSALISVKTMLENNLVPQAMDVLRGAAFHFGVAKLRLERIKHDNPNMDADRRMDFINAIDHIGEIQRLTEEALSATGARLADRTAPLRQKFEEVAALLGEGKGLTPEIEQKLTDIKELAAPFKSHEGVMSLVESVRYGGEWSLEDANMMLSIMEYDLRFDPDKAKPEDFLAKNFSSSEPKKSPSSPKGLSRRTFLSFGKAAPLLLGASSPSVESVTEKATSEDIRMITEMMASFDVWERAITNDEDMGFPEIGDNHDPAEFVEKRRLFLAQQSRLKKLLPDLMAVFDDKQLVFGQFLTEYASAHFEDMSSAIFGASPLYAEGLYVALIDPALYDLWHKTKRVLSLDGAVQFEQNDFFRAYASGIRTPESYARYAALRYFIPQATRDIEAGEARLKKEGVSRRSRKPIADVYRNAEEFQKGLLKGESDLSKYNPAREWIRENRQAWFLKKAKQFMRGFAPERKMGFYLPSGRHSAAYEDDLNKRYSLQTTLENFKREVEKRAKDNWMNRIRFGLYSALEGKNINPDVVWWTIRGDSRISSGSLSLEDLRNFNTEDFVANLIASLEGIDTESSDSRQLSDAVKKSIVKMQQGISADALEIHRWENEGGILSAGVRLAQKSIQHGGSKFSKKTSLFTYQRRLNHLYQQVLSDVLASRKKQGKADEPLKVVYFGLGGHGAPTLFDLARRADRKFPRTLIYGVDNHPKALQEARENLRSEGNFKDSTDRTRVRIRYGDFDGGLKIKNADLIIAANVLVHYHERREDAIAALRRSLAPDGLLVVATASPDKLSYYEYYSKAAAQPWKSNFLYKSEKSGARLAGEDQNSRYEARSAHQKVKARRNQLLEILNQAKERLTRAQLAVALNRLPRYKEVPVMTVINDTALDPLRGHPNLIVEEREPIDKAAIQKRRGALLQILNQTKALMTRTELTAKLNEFPGYAAVTVAIVTDDARRDSLLENHEKLKKKRTVRAEGEQDHSTGARLSQSFVLMPESTATLPGDSEEIKFTLTSLADVPRREALKVIQSLPISNSEWISFANNLLPTILHDLIDNSVDSILERLVSDNKTDPVLSLRIFVRDGALWVEIKDNGSGFRTEDLEKNRHGNERFSKKNILGPPFYWGGNGVALTQTKSRIAKVGGELIVQNIPADQGTGAIVSLKFPLSADDYAKVRNNGARLAAFNEESESIVALRANYQKIFEAFDVLKPSSKGILDRAKLEALRRNFNRQGDRWTPRANDTRALTTRIDNDRLIRFLKNVTRRVRSALPAGTAYYDIPEATYHASIYELEDLRPGDLDVEQATNRPSDLRLTAHDLKKMEVLARRSVNEETEYSLRLTGIRFGTDGGVIGVFEDDGQTVGLRKRLDAAKWSESIDTNKTKYPKPIIHVTLFRILDDVSPDTLVKLQKLNRSFKSQEERIARLNLVQLVSVRYVHETGWLLTKLESEETLPFSGARLADTTTAQKILDAVSDLEKQNGNITLESIAEKAGINRHVLYMERKNNQEIRELTNKVIHADGQILRAIRSLQKENKGPINQLMIAERANLDPSTISRRKAANPGILEAVEKATNGTRLSVFSPEALPAFFSGVAVAHAVEINGARLPLKLDKTYIFKISVNGSRLTAEAEGMAPIEFDMKKPKENLREETSGTKLSIADLRQLVNETQSKVDEELAGVNVSSDKTVILKINLEFLNNASYTLYIDELLRALNAFKETKDGQNVLFQAAGNERLLQYALSSAENKAILTQELPGDLKDASIVIISPTAAATDAVSINVPVDSLQEGDLPVFRAIVKLSVFAGRIDLSSIPDNFRNAYSTLSSQAIDSSTLQSILKGKASLETIKQFALRAITKVPLQQLFQFFRLQKKIEQSA